MEKQSKVELKRFTTLVEPNLLSQTKLISYFTNKKLSECINESLSQYIKNFEVSNNTSISKLIDFQSQFTQLNNESKSTK